jgi:beta-N-acetylhexosaminidase
VTKADTGRLLMVGLPGPEVDEEARELIVEHHVGAVCLFARNIEGPAQVRDLCASLRALAAEAGDPPPLIAIDQEGGTVQRLLDPATEWPGNMALGATGSSDLTRRAAEATALELRAVGVNWNLAPVVDVNNNPDNPIIGVRSFGADPALVSRLGAAAIEGYRRGGVAACAKHFPGHGDTAQDSHLTLPTVPHDRARLEAVELPPFRAAIDAGVPSIMTAHITFPAIDPTPGLPATLSHPVLTGLLRRELGFRGVIVADALEMAAIADHFGIGEAAVRAIEAGADVAPVCSGIERQREAAAAAADAAASGRLSADRIDASLARIDALRAGCTPADQPPLGVVGCAAHQALSREIAEASITVVRDRAGSLPLRVPPEERLLVVALNDLPRTPVETRERATGALADAVRRRVANVDQVLVDPDPTDEQIAGTLAAAARCTAVVVATLNVHLHAGQARLVAALHAAGRSPIVTSLASPFDLRHFPEIDSYLCAYSWRRCSIEAAVAAIWDEIEPRGRLPVAIPGAALE